jgi:hypothetical protein
MAIKDALGFLSVVLSFIGYSNYLWSIFKKHTKPHAFSWLVWSLLMGIVFWAQLSNRGGAGAWVTGASALMCSVIAIAALRYGEKSITRGDWLAFAGALIAIPVWCVTQNPLMAVIVATVIDGLAYFPTFRKSYLKPFEENFQTYCFDILKWIVALFALENYVGVTLVYPLFLILANSCLVAMILWRRKRVLCAAKKAEG